MKLFTVLLTVCVIGSSAAAQPAGYHVGAAVVLPDSLVEVFAHGRFRASVLRIAADSNDARLITAAEQLYPDAGVILATARNPADRARLLESRTGVLPARWKVPQRAAGNPADRWWIDDFDATWTPFAITGGAVEYYLERLHDYADGRGPFGFSAAKGSDKGSLRYTARVGPSSEPGIARVVELRVDWEYWCGYLCAMEFVHTRRVYFDAAGKAVRVEGDGRPEVVVS